MGTQRQQKQADVQEAAVVPLGGTGPSLLVLALQPHQLQMQTRNVEVSLRLRRSAEHCIAQGICLTPP